MRATLTLLALAACAPPTAADLVAPPPPADFDLVVGNIIAGSPFDLSLSGAPPSTSVKLGYSTAGLGSSLCPPVLAGRCLSLATPASLAPLSLTTDAAGNATTQLTLPSSMAGLNLALQAVVLGGAPEMSNPVARVIGAAGIVLSADMDQDGDGYTQLLGDCADFDVNIGPEAPDLVGDGRDDNCDNVDGVDFDGDGVASVASGGLDCDDGDPDVNPDAIEQCDLIDHDCDGDTSNGLVTTAWYPDLDGDGFGADVPAVDSCAPIPQHTTTSWDDCDDDDPATHPGATEVCDDLDNDCNGIIEDHVDGDMDGFDLCSDCNDNDPDVRPGIMEICDGVDTNCDGETPAGSVFTSSSGPSIGAGQESHYVAFVPTVDHYIDDFRWNGGTYGNQQQSLSVYVTGPGVPVILEIAHLENARQEEGFVYYWTRYEGVDLLLEAGYTYFFEVRSPAREVSIFRTSGTPSLPESTGWGDFLGGSTSSTMLVNGGPIPTVFTTDYQVQLVTRGEEDADLDGFPQCAECDDTRPDIYPGQGACPTNF